VRDSKEAEDPEDDDGNESSDEPEPAGEGGADVDDRDQAVSGVAADLEGIVPIVQAEVCDSPSSGGHDGITMDSQGLTRIPIPSLRPDDPVVRIILDTCDIYEFRRPVIVFKGAGSGGWTG